LIRVWRWNVTERSERSNWAFGCLALAEELFAFVREPEVVATNNLMKRELWNPALERKAGRTNNTAAGAHRRSVIVSVLQSLRGNLGDFCLTNVLEEIGRWMKERMSPFAKQWQALHAAGATTANTG
jgi:hypothetical protein